MINKKLNTNFYTGIGSRQTPDEVQNEIVKWSNSMQNNWILRSGGAKGADDAFERGITISDRKEIYLPWAQFGGRQGSGTYTVTSFAKSIQRCAQEIAKRYHPFWEKLTSGGEILMTRNVMQILGQDLKTPSDFVVCWAQGLRYDKDGRILDAAGGTGQAIRLAYSLFIPVLYWNDPTHQNILKSYECNDIVKSHDLLRKTCLWDKKIVYDAVAHLHQGLT